MPKAKEVIAPDVTDQQLREMLDLPPLPNRKPKQRWPNGEPPATFEDALGYLSKAERKFVQVYLAHPERGAKNAYKAAYPKASLDTCARKGPDLLERKHIRHTIDLGREAMADGTIEGLKFDVEASFKELSMLIDEAREAKQYTAAVRAAELKAKLYGLLVEKHEVKAETFSLVFNDMPTPPQLNGPKTVDGERLTDETEPKLIEHEGEDSGEQV